MRAKFPFLDTFSDMFVCTTPPDSLLKMRESERSRDADNKLSADRAALSTTSKAVGAGTYDR